MNERIIRWGILGLGWIAERFLSDFRKLKGCRVTALGSRSLDKARAFQKRMGLGNARAYGSYGEVCADPEVDVVYVATPHTLHCENTLMALAAGKAVLCEKPLAVNMPQVEAMIKAARDKGLFLMEAMWTAFLPVIREVKNLIAQGAVGDLQRIMADLSLCLEWNPAGRIYNPALAGGAHLDLGVYPLSLVQYLFGDEPYSLAASAHTGQTGVDEHTCALLAYPGARFAQISACARFQSASEAQIMGTAGRIVIPSFFMAQSARIESKGKLPYTIRRQHGYHFQVAEVNTCLREGLSESTIMPLVLLARVMQSMDTIREQIGLRYPFE